MVDEEDENDDDDDWKVSLRLGLDCGSQIDFSAITAQRYEYLCFMCVSSSPPSTATGTITTRN